MASFAGSVKLCKDEVGRRGIDRPFPVIMLDPQYGVFVFQYLAMLIASYLLRDTVISLCVREVAAWIGSEPLGARIAGSGTIRTSIQRSDSGEAVAAGEFGDRCGVA